MGNTDKFEMIAGTYDTADRVNIAQLSSAAIREYLENTSDKTAIDFGCGTGLVGLELVQDFKSMLFLDTSPNMLKEIERKLADSAIQNAKTICFDFEHDNRMDLRADYILMAQVLLHIPDVETLLSRLYNVLHPGGHLIIVDFDKNEAVVSDIVHPGFEQDELTRLMTNLGYGHIQSKTFYTGRKLFMGQDASMFILDAQK